MKTFRLISAFASLFMLLNACTGTIEPDKTGGDEGDEAIVQGEKITSVYKQKMVAMQFTSVGCVNCPSLSASIKAVQEKQPGALIPVALHLNYGEGDPMALAECRMFYERVSYDDVQDGLSLPMFAMNFRKSSQKIVDQQDRILSEIGHQAETYPVSSGVAVNTTYDKASGKLEVTARFISEVKQSARYHIILVEDGIKYMQTGAETADYTHDNVFRYISSDNLKGTNLNAGSPLVPGVEYQVTKTIALSKDWNPDSMRVIAVLLTPDDAAGKNFGCNNANECAVGKSVDFLYAADEEVAESRFERNVCVMEFTGQWCSYCPDGARLLEFLSSDIYPGQFNILAFHNEDSFTIPAESDLRTAFNISGWPAYLTDMRDCGELSGSGCRLSIDKSLYETTTHSSVAVTSVVDGGKCRVDAKLFSEKSMNYRMAAYAVEDRIIAYQTTSGNTKDEDYVHRHVVRRMLSGSINGDDLGTVEADQEKAHSFEFSIDPAWNLDNMTVAVLAIDKNGHVNNMTECALNGGKVEYEMKK